MPCLDDNTGKTLFDRHYIFHTAWAFRKVVENMPMKHIDISSSLYFSTSLSAILPVEFYDFRPPKIELDNFNAYHADLNHLPFKNCSQNSISCMHVVEHIGLGRYGDPIDPDGDLKAIDELKRTLKPSGKLLFVVPIGKPFICFNAHRIYTHEQILSYFKNFSLLEFSLIPDNPKDGDIVTNPSETLINKQNYGCGCYLFKK